MSYKGSDDNTREVRTLHIGGDDTTAGGEGPTEGCEDSTG